MIDVTGKRGVSLGCGLIRHGEDILHVDCRPTPAVDVVMDVDVKPWALPDEAFTVVYAQDILEHVVDPFGFIEEAWRILKPEGMLYVRMPNWAHPSGQGFRAMDHRRQGHKESLDVFCRGTTYFAGYSFYSWARFEKLSVVEYGAELCYELRKAILDDGTWQHPSH